MDLKLSKKRVWLLALNVKGLLPILSYSPTANDRHLNQRHCGRL